MTSAKYFDAFSLVVTRGHSWSTRDHSWSLVVTGGHSWSFVVNQGHSCVLLDMIQQSRTQNRVLIVHYFQKIYCPNQDRPSKVK